MLLVLPYMHVVNEQTSYVDPKTIGKLVSVGLVLVVLVSIHLINKHNHVNVIPKDLRVNFMYWI